MAGLFGGESLADTQPLRKTIASYITPDLLSRIAAEYRKGRILIIVTTNLDAQRAVLWDMGRIAEVGSPEARDLFIDVMLASSSIPGAFPPVYIETTTPKGRIKEMHVDGGTATQILMIPETLLLEADIASDQNPVEIYAIINSRLEPEFEIVKARTFSLFERAASTLLKSTLRLQMATIKLLDQRPGIEVFVTAIGSDFKLKRTEPFMPSYMEALFEYGKNEGLKGLNGR